MCDLIVSLVNMILACQFRLLSEKINSCLMIYMAFICSKSIKSIKDGEVSPTW